MEARIDVSLIHEGMEECDAEGEKNEAENLCEEINSLEFVVDEEALQSHPWIVSRCLGSWALIEWIVFQPVFNR